MSRAGRASTRDCWPNDTACRSMALTWTRRSCRSHRRKHPAGRFVLADMSDFHLGRHYDAVICLFSSIGYVRTLDRVTHAIGRFRDHLAPGGVDRRRTVVCTGRHDVRLHIDQRWRARWLASRAPCHERRSMVGSRASTSTTTSRSTGRRGTRARSTSSGCSLSRKCVARSRQTASTWNTTRRA